MEKTDRASISRSPEDTHRLAAELLTDLRAGSILALHGELGSGKTCFVQGLAKALGIDRAVNSPTFAIVNEYPGHPPLYHMDLYRIHSAAEALDLGLDEYLHGRGITAIEWAERVSGLLPPTTLHIRFEPGNEQDERVITIRKGES